MNIPGIVRVLAGFAGAATAGFALATTIVVDFPELDGPQLLSSDPYPQPPITVASGNYAIPAGEQILAATLTGFWGTTAKPNSTAGVDC